MNRDLMLRARFGVLAMLVLTAALYWPGLNGSYLFDDFPNIVDNNAVHVTTLDWQDWKHAASASPARDLPRPLAMLSYAANYYFTGIDPRPMKLTNLLIHLTNGALLYATLRLLLGLWNQRNNWRLEENTITVAAAGLSGAWLICPINLSSVLYVVQRMEILAQTFVLIGLLVYLHGRQIMLTSDKGPAVCAAGLAAGTGLGLLCKETAALLPLYAFLIEFMVLRFAATNQAKRRLLYAVYAVLLFIPVVVSLTWLLPHYLSAESYAGRPFTLTQRLLTELRVVVDYIAWVLFPRPQDLGFYHDDIGLSYNWLSPPSTLGSGLLIVGLLLSAVMLRRKVPLYSLGIVWYFAAHLLTATVIPLELVFEHRNYFASIGLLLAVIALILEVPPHLKLSRSAFTVVVFSIYAGVTALRAHEWGDAIRFALTEAGEHPDSPRANYELGRTLAVASGYRSDSKLVDPAVRAFERAAALPGSDAAASAGLIIVANHMHRPVKAEWWQMLSKKLAERPPSQEDISALQSLADCQHKGECVGQTPQLLSAFLAALSHKSPSSRLLANFGAFTANELGDYVLAESAFSDAIALAPRITAYKLDLAAVLILDQKQKIATSLLDQLSSTDLDHDDSERFNKLKHLITTPSIQ